MPEPTEATYEAVAGRTVFYAVIAPRWRAPSRPVTGLGPRLLLFWQVVRETRGQRWDDGKRCVWGYEHHSAHWTRRAAHRAASRATGETGRG